MTRDEKARIAREQSRRIASDSGLRRRLASADYGRRLTWVVEWHGVSVALLSNPKSMADHWLSYEILALTVDPDRLRALETAAFWLHPDLVFRNIEQNLVATHAVAAGEGPAKGRISVQGLQFDFKLSFRDQLHLLWRRWRT